MKGFISTGRARPSSTIRSHRLTPVTALAIAATAAALLFADAAAAMKIAGGHFDSYWIKDDQSLFAWGDNFTGQIGDGTKVDRASPTKIAGLPKVLDAAGGEAHTVAVSSDGAVFGWGRTTADRSATART